MLGPCLHGEMIRLEPLELEDLKYVRSWLTDPDITHHWGNFRGYSEQQIGDWYKLQAESDKHVRWRVTLGETVIGMTVIEDIDWIHRHAETGIMIGDRSAWERGCASEAIHLRTQYAFEELGLERLGSISMSENIPMHVVLAKAGYRQVGRMQRYFYRHGAWHDAVIFELLRDEWLARADQNRTR